MTTLRRRQIRFQGLRPPAACTASVSVVNALSEKLVEAARGRKLYRQDFARRRRAGFSRSANSQPARTRDPLQPDADIFGAGARFVRRGSTAAARSKAYLFGGGNPLSATPRS